MAASTFSKDVSSSAADPMVVIFGRAGAGKSTVANAALRLLKERGNTDHELDRLYSVVALDLDICVPQWMRDNFAKGIYPTLEQRKEFALSACDFVESELSNNPDGTDANTAGNASKAKAAIISFSFVNVDLREIFRERFPHATWALMNVTDETAEQRLKERVGHFYKGAPHVSESRVGEEGHKSTASATESKVSGVDGDPVEGNEGNNDVDNSEWDFAPVAYPHIELNGLDIIELNAKRVIDALDALVAKGSEGDAGI